MSADDGQLDNDQRLSLLYRLYDALLRCLLAALEAETPPKAIVLDVARKLLADNGIKAVSRSELRKGLQTMGELSALPFDPSTGKRQ